MRRCASTVASPVDREIRSAVRAFSKASTSGNRRLEREDPAALRYLLAGVPPIAEWAAEGVDVRGGCQQLAGTVAVAILGLDRAEP